MATSISRAIGAALVVLVGLAGIGAAVGSAGTGSGPAAPTHGSQSFGYTGVGWSFTVPEDVYYLYASVRGGHGGGGFDHAAQGGRAGQVETVLPVTPGQGLVVYVGEFGWHKGGWGAPGSGGDHGAAWGPSSGHSGDGGGGSSMVAAAGSELTALVVAGGGGGAGGDDSNHAWGGNGGDGGLPAEQGFPGYGQGGKINDEGRVGGCGGCRSTSHGDSGEHTSFGEVVGGGGGGGGGGYKGGDGGDNGVYRFEQVDNIGGSGGGGGSSWVTGSALDTKYSVASGSCAGGDNPVSDCFGEVVLSWGEPPARVSVASGSGQSATVTNDFAPIAAKVTDANGIPVVDQPVNFTLPTAGPAGTFPGGASTTTVKTNRQGVAAVPRLTANGIAGQWTAKAAVDGLAQPATFNLNNLPAETKTVVNSTPDPSIYGEIPVIEATVSSGAPDLRPTGAVQFTVDDDPAGYPVQLGSNGKVTLPEAQIPPLLAGTHQIEATYHGDAGHSSSSGSREQTVRKVPTAIRMTATPSPSNAGEDVTLTAEVNPSTVPPGTGTPTGQVAFSVGGAALGSAPLDGSATAEIVTDALPVGASVIDAAYPGDAFYADATGELTHGVGPEATVTQVESSANPVVWGSGVTWTAVARRTDQGAALEGTIAFALDGEPLCGHQQVGADGRVECEAPPGLAAGTHRVSASYEPPSGSGDLPSAGAMTQVVSPARTSVTTTADPEPSAFGEDVKLEASVTAEAGRPAGDTTFYLDSAILGTVPLGADDTASIAESCATDGCSLTPGTHMVEAEFSPADANHYPSEAAHVHQVAPAPTSVTLSASRNPVPANEPLVLTAAVSGPGNIAAPAGRVLFTVDGEDAGDAVTISGGQARSLPIEGLTEGEHLVAARYLGSPAFSPSADETTQQVGPPDHDFGTPSLEIVSKRAVVNRHGSTRILARCFGEPGARCRGRAVIRNLKAARITNLRRPGARRVKSNMAVAIDFLSMPTGSRRHMRIDLNNVGGRIVSATPRLPVRYRFIPEPGTAQMKIARLTLRGVSAPAARITRVRSTKRKVTPRIICRGGDGNHCVGKLVLSVKGKAIAARGFRLRNRTGRAVPLAVPRRLRRPAVAKLTVRSDVLVGRDVTTSRKVRLP